MEESKDFKNLDALFEKARSSNPVMGVEEVRNLISTEPFANLDNVNPQKSNKSLYIVLISLLFVVATSAVWYTFSGSNNDLSNAQNNGNLTPEVVTKEQASVNNNNQIDNEAEISKEVKNLNESSAIASEELATTNKNTEQEATFEKEVPMSNINANTIETKSPEVIPAANSNKTSIVKGSDMEVKISDSGKDISMKVKQDYSVDDLTINGKEIAEVDYKKYKNYIDQGVKIAMDDRANKPDANDVSSKSLEDQKRDELNTRLFNTFSEQLKKDKLVNQDKFSFRLSSSEMQIDGKTLPITVQKKYLDLFKNTAGRELGGTVFKFEHGLK